MGNGYCLINYDKNITTGICFFIYYSKLLSRRSIKKNPSPVYERRPALVDPLVKVALKEMGIKIIEKLSIRVPSNYHRNLLSLIRN